MPVIDADAHVIETERTWEFMEPFESRFKPVLFAPEDRPMDAHWIVDGKLRRRAMLDGRGGGASLRSEVRSSAPAATATRNTYTLPEAREMADISARVKHMDELGIDIQILHNSIFIEAVADRPEVDVAICKSWNRWLADIWEKGQGRFRWSCVLPLHSMNDAVDEIRFAKEHGSVAVCMRPLEGTRTLADPYFYPIYEEASLQNMAISIHIANGNPGMVEIFRNPYGGAGLGTFKAMTAVACHGYMTSLLPDRFPELRWGFIEASSQWVPWVAAELGRRGRSEDAGSNPFKDKRVYVTCQSGDDIAYVLKYIGEDNLIIGTDYGHTDTASELDAISQLRKRTDISQEAIRKIIDDNPHRYYGI